MISDEEVKSYFKQFKGLDVKHTVVLKDGMPDPYVNYMEDMYAAFKARLVGECYMPQIFMQCNNKRD